MALDEQLRQLAERVPPPPAGDPQAAFRQGQRRRKRRRTSVASGLVLAVLGVTILVTQTVTGPPLVIDPTAPRDASVLAVPEPGTADPAHLEDGTPVFVSHLDDGEVIVVDATSPDNQALLAFCERGGGLEEPRHGSKFTADGTWIFGPSPTGLAAYPYEHVGDSHDPRQTASRPTRSLMRSASAPRPATILTVLATTSPTSSHRAVCWSSAANAGSGGFGPTWKFAPARCCCARRHRVGRTCSRSRPLTRTGSTSSAETVMAGCCWQG